MEAVETSGQGHQGHPDTSPLLPLTAPRRGSGDRSDPDGSKDLGETVETSGLDIGHRDASL